MEIVLGPGDIVLDGDPAPPPKKRGTAPNFWPMSVVTKWLPNSATAEHLFLFVYEISLEPLNGFAPNSHKRCVWSLTWTSLKVNDQGHQGQKQHFTAISEPACGLCLVKHL